MGLYVQGGKKVGGMYMADGRGNATKVGGMYYADGKGNAVKIFQDYVPSGTVLWSGNAIFCSQNSDPIMNHTGMVRKSALALPKNFKNLRGIKLTFRVGVIVKTDDLNGTYIFTSGESGDPMERDGTSVTYPLSVTVTQEQLMSGNTTVFKKTDIKFYPSETRFAINDGYKYDLKMYTNRTNSLVLAQPNQGLTNFSTMIVSNNYDSRGGNYYYAYPVLTKIEAI